MSTIPPGMSRVPNLLLSRAALSNLTRTSLGLFRVQTQMATGQAINRFSDDSVRAAAISVLDDRLERADQRARNLQHAESALNALDAALNEGGELLLEAKDIASTQVNLGSTALEREQQAEIVQSLIDGLLTVVNRRGAAGSLFGGATPGVEPVGTMLGGYRYVGRGDGLITDLGSFESVPITLGAPALGAVSARVEGTVDLDPVLTGDTRLSEVGGALGLGVARGSIEFSFDDGPRAVIDLTTVETAQDVADAITLALQEYEQAHGVQILGPGGVGYAGGAFTLDVAPALTGPDPVLRFFDAGAGTTARDLGLTGDTPTDFSAQDGSGADVNPRATWRSAVGDLAGVTGSLGRIRVKSLGHERVVDLSSAATLGDLRNLIEGTGLGLRVEINETGNAINVLNEVAGGRGQAMSIEDVAGEGSTATRLGIRSMDASTRIADFNDGRGVQLVHGAVNPTTGLPDPALDIDFAITLGDSSATEFSVDLRPQDLTTVQTLLDRINAQARAAGVAVPADFEAALGDGPNGIELRQNLAFASPLRVETRNNSPAAEQLGLTDGTFDAPTGTLRGVDRATVRVDNVFTHLIDLRDALMANDTSGITLAGERLEDSIDRFAQTRALVGGFASRVEAGQRRQEDTAVIDERTRSELRDLDFTEAAVRLSMLQTQLQAGLQTTAIRSSLSLLDFLG